MVIATSSSISILRDSKKPVTANLLLQYALRHGRPTSPESEEITTI
jgi:hypothetical protein